MCWFIQSRWTHCLRVICWLLLHSLIFELNLMQYIIWNYCQIQSFMDYVIENSHFNPEYFNLAFFQLKRKKYSSQVIVGSIQTSFPLRRCKRWKFRINSYIYCVWTYCITFLCFSVIHFLFLKLAKTLQNL